MNALLCIITYIFQKSILDLKYESYKSVVSA